jgi:hypothetical protein
MLKSVFHRLGLFLPMVMAATALAGPHKLRVTDRALAESLIAQGGKLLTDYKSFQIVEVEETPSAKIAAGRAQLVDNYNSIQLNAKSLDTRTPEIQALRKGSGTFTGRRLQLVQFVGPIKPEWREALERMGVKIISYLPQNAYLVYGDAPALAQLHSWAGAEAFVQWDGEYAGEYKTHPRARTVDQKGNPRQIGTDTFAIQMVADADANSATLRLIEQLRLAPVVRSSDALGYHNVIVALPADQLDVIAAQPDVVSIHPYFTPKKHDERQDQILAGNLIGNSPSGPGYLDWLASKGFTQAQFDASGFVVDVSDSGIDNGTTTPGHFAFYPQADISRASRVAYNRLEGSPNKRSTLSGCDGHGNLNAHILAGYDAFAGGFPHSDFEGYSYGLGVCPFVKVGSSVVFDPNNFTGPDYPTLLTDAYNSGARISNNSWGSSGAGVYDSDAQQYDMLVRDVGGGANNRAMVVVFVAGNETNAMTINSPGSAKNVLTVGASENVRSLLPPNGNDSSGSDGCGTLDTEANSANDITDFSSQGPCADGRAKPDLVAPGTHITGGAPQSGAPTTNGTGNASSCFDGSGVCGLPGSGTVGSPDNFFPLGQKFYTVSSGTSHAAPAVSGACALLRQYFINNGLELSNAPPSPAMTKAFLMNSARYLTGNFANDTLPSPSQGLGELNLGKAFDGVARVLRDQHPLDIFTASGQTRTFSGFVADHTKPFRVTLAWTDAAGSTAAANALVNDLDLTVAVGGNTYKGNVFNGANSDNGGTADSLNNVESVFLPAGVTGAYTVTITAANIAADGISNGASLPQQDFALVIYNATLTPAPAISVGGYAVTNESCVTANGAVDPGETVTVDFTLQNLGTADTTNLEVTLLQTNGVVDPSVKQEVGALVANGAAVKVPFTFTAAGSCGDTITPTFSLKDGSKNLGNIAVNIPLGTLATIYLQNFDGMPAPTLPAWWTTTKSNSQSLWVVSKGASDTAPNAAFSSESSKPGVNALISPAIPLPSGAAQLVFRNSYNLESGYDGGVLEIKIGDGAFLDILDAGGSFSSGGYNATLKASANPLAGRAAWSGNSSGFITTTLNLPPAASGQTIQLQWRCATDQGMGGAGWRIDSVQINSYWCCPSPPPVAPFVPAAASYNGLFFDTIGVQVPSSGAISASVNGRGTYSGSLQLGVSKLSFAGTFDPFGAASNNITRKVGAPLKLLMQMETSDNSRIMGTVGDATWLAALDAERSVFDAKTNPAPFAGKYTLIFPGPGNPADTTQPQGDGYGAVTVTTAGLVTLSGKLADGTTLSQTAKASQDWLWPYYSSLYSGKGQILGWLAFSNSPPNLGGTFNWIKPASTTKSYPAGFSVQTNATGSSYQPPASGIPLLNFTSGNAIFLGGNYFGSFTNAATNTPGNKLTYKGTNNFSLALKTSQGLFTGSLKDPATGKTVSFSGAILQTQQVASGFLLGTNQSGKVTLGP